MYDGNHAGTIAMNLVWACFNLVVLGVATSVAWESRQRRQAIRIAIKVPADVQLSSGVIVRGVTGDISTTGMMLRMEQEFVARMGEAVKITLPVLDGNATLPATLVGIGASSNILRAQFDPLTLQEEEALAMILYSRADTWLGWGESREIDKPITSMRKIVRLSFNGIRQTLRDDTRPRTKFATSILPLLLIAVLSTVAASQVVPPPATQSPVPSSAQAVKAIPNSPPATDTFDNTVTLADLGVTNTIVLHGADASRTIRFSLPQTHVAKTATMHLRYHFSPALLPSISHLKISLNGTSVPTVPATTPPATETAPIEANTTHKENGSLQETTLTLPAEALAPINELTFEFVGHSTPKCEDPSNSALWSHVDNTSTIEFAGSLVALPDNLKSLPAPFYDSRVDLHPSIPIVFLTQPSPKTLQAAGIVASWFGMLARSRPIRFSVSIATIPKGNAIVLAENSAALPASLRMTTTTGPTIAMRPNPSDAYAKILILTGNSAEDVLTAATALSLPPNLFEGDTVSTRSLMMPAPRAPDDAPRWLSTETVTPFGDIIDTGSLESNGRSPIAIYPRLPPDLYYGTRQNLNLHLAYRYNSIPLADGSTLQVKANGSYVGSIPLHTGETSTQPETVIPIPVSAFRPFSNSLLMRFFFKLAQKDECQNTAPDDNLNGSILKDSYLDIQGIPHWATLPNLEIFANAGYPFTRRADLSDTAVVLPDAATTEEIEMYLTLMGHFGAQTGYPVLNVSVTNADGMTSDRTKDYLVLGTVEDQPAINRLNPALPVGVDGSGLHIQDTQGFFSPLQHAWWKVRSSERVQPGQLETDGGLPDALIEGIEWPAGSKHSAVVIVLRDQDIVPNFLSTFLRTSQSSDISQSVSVLHDSRFNSYRIGDNVYHVGSLSLSDHLKMFFEDNQWLMVLAVLCFCLLMAAILRAILRRKARIRLHGNG
jgi:cellulose synthase (UDP-forming)